MRIRISYTSRGSTVQDTVQIDSFPGLGATVHWQQPSRTAWSNRIQLSDVVSPRMSFLHGFLLIRNRKSEWHTCRPARIIWGEGNLNYFKLLKLQRQSSGSWKSINQIVIFVCLWDFSEKSFIFIDVNLRHLNIQNFKTPPYCFSFYFLKTTIYFWGNVSVSHTSLLLQPYLWKHLSILRC